MSHRPTTWLTADSRNIYRLYKPQNHNVGSLLLLLIPKLVLPKRTKWPTDQQINGQTDGHKCENTRAFSSSTDWRNGKNNQNSIQRQLDQSARALFGSQTTGISWPTYWNYSLIQNSIRLDSTQLNLQSTLRLLYKQTARCLAPVPMKSIEFSRKLNGEQVNQKSVATHWPAHLTFTLPPIDGCQLGAWNKL